MAHTSLGLLPLDTIHRQALRILETVGLAVESPAALRILDGRAGVRIDGQRVRFSPALIEEESADNRAALEARLDRSEMPGDAPSIITVGCGDMPQHYRCPRTGTTALFSTSTLVEATRFLEAVAGEGPDATPRSCWSMVPGVPRDVPHQVQALTEYAIGCEWCSGGGNVDTLHPPEAMPYLFAMAEAMGREVDCCGIFTVSPLRLGGFELDTAVAMRDRFDSYGVASLPAAGGSGPVYPLVNWAVSLAEVLGAAAVLRLVSGGLPVHLSPGMYPFDLRALSIVGGAPEHVLMQYGAFQLARRYDPGARYSHTITTQARHPGLQAGMEKACGAGVAVALGCREVNGAGMLGFDDVFSPEQFLADKALRDSLQQVIRPEPSIPEDGWLALVEEGLSGFAVCDATLDHHADVYAYPRFLERSTMYGPQGRKAEDAFREEAANLAEKPCLWTPGTGIETVRALLRRAWKDLAGSIPPPIANDGTRG